MPDLTGVVAKGDYPDSMRELRDWLTAEIDRESGFGRGLCESCRRGPGGTAPLAKLLAEVLEKIEALPKREASKVDDLASKRAKRRSAKVPDQTAVGK